MKYAALIVASLAIGLAGGFAISRAVEPAAAAATAAATPAPTPTPVPVPTFSARSFTVEIRSESTSEDAAPSQIAQRLRSSLAAAWNVATRGRSTLFVGGSSHTDVLIVVDSSKNPRQSGWSTVGASGVRVIVMHEVDAGTPQTYTMVAVHELGHALGCCQGAGSDGTHVADCPAPTTQDGIIGRNVPIMCPSGGYAPTFNDYELAQMSLGTP